MINNKRGFLDTEILTSAGFVILGGGAVLATLIGFVWGKRMGWQSLPIWQLLIILLVELGVTYFFIERG